MAAAIQTNEPSQVRAGETLSFLKSLGEFPASDGWTLTYSLKPQANGGQKISFSSTSSGTSHQISVDCGTTAGWMPGEYLGVGMVTDGTSRYQFWTGTITILPDLSSDDSSDIRSQNRRTLDNINAVIEQRATHDILSSTINGVAFGRMPVDQLLALQKEYEEKVYAEECALAGRPTRRNMLFRFK